MTGETPPAGGLPRRRRRQSEDEVAERMLTTAVGMVTATGLTVSLDHIGFEDVIREAGVARSAVYRHWPYKDLFFSDLLKELADGARPAMTPDEPETYRALVRERLDRLGDPAERLALIAELLRVGSAAELPAFRDSPDWRTYIALQATFLSLPESELREEVRAALTRSEDALTERLAAAYASFAALVGCRLKPSLGLGYADVARLTSAAMRGMVIMAPTSPALTGETIATDPFGTGTAEWSAPGLAIAGIVMGFVEADPDVVFDEARTAEVRALLDQDG
ncbi:MAG TPA: TetR/AcrR family transcriptional regulator [Phytomonospora sp.]